MPAAPSHSQWQVKGPTVLLPQLSSSGSQPVWHPQQLGNAPAEAALWKGCRTLSLPCRCPEQPCRLSATLSSPCSGSIRCGPPVPLSGSAAHTGPARGALSCRAAGGSSRGDARSGAFHPKSRRGEGSELRGRSVRCLSPAAALPRPRSALGVRCIPSCRRYPQTCPRFCPSPTNPGMGISRHVISERRHLSELRRPGAGAQ